VIETKLKKLLQDVFVAKESLTWEWVFHKNGVFFFHIYLNGQKLKILLGNSWSKLPMVKATSIKFVNLSSVNKIGF